MYYGRDSHDADSVIYPMAYQLPGRLQRVVRSCAPDGAREVYGPYQGRGQRCNFPLSRFPSLSVRSSFDWWFPLLA